MQGFRQFASNAYNTVSDLLNQALDWFRGWWQRFSTTMLGSARIAEDGAVHFQPTVTEATHYVGGKGQKILRNIDTSDWQSRQVTSFKTGINNKLRNIATFLGKQCEVDVVLHLAKQFRLKLDADENELIELRRDLSDKIQRHLFNQFVYQQFDKYVQRQAAQLAESIYNRTTQLLKCKPTTVSYLPNGTGGRSADLSLSCAGAEQMPWSLKFTSEPLVTVRTLSVAEAYKLLGGNDSGKNIDYYNQIRNMPDRQEMTTTILDDLESAVREGGVLNDPQRFASLLQFLIRGNEKSLLAISNYILNQSEVGTASQGMLQNFDVRGTKNGLIFTAKPNATVTVSRSTQALRLNYRTPSGTSRGVSIVMEINQKTDESSSGIRIQFKVTNLVNLK